MNRSKALLFLPVLLLAVFSLAACSGPKKVIVCTVNCTTGGATVSFTLSAIPIAPPPGTSLLSFALTISGISLTPASGGSDVVLPLNSANYVVDLTRLQSDSAFAGQILANVPAGTYNKITVGVTTAVVTYCTSLGGVAGCDIASVAQISKTLSTPSTSSFSATFSSGQKTGVQIRFNIGKALTINATTQVVSAVDLTAANFLTAATLPPLLSSLAAGQLDFVEDFTGVVTAASNTSVTVQTSTRGVITAKVTPTTLASPNCVINNAVCTAQVGQIASLDTVLNTDGTFSLLEYDPLDQTSSDVVEGIVTATPLTSTQFDIVANDILLKSASSLIGTNLSVGAPVHVTLSGSVAPFAVDGKGLPLTATSFAGSTSATNILPGQTVALRVTQFTAASGKVPALVTANAVVLRYTRVAGAISFASGQTFNMQSVPLFFGPTLSYQVQLSNGTPSTYYDGVTLGSNLIVGNTAAMRALYFGPVAPAFTAAKVRQF